MARYKGNPIMGMGQRYTNECDKVGPVYKTRSDPNHSDKINIDFRKNMATGEARSAGHSGIEKVEGSNKSGLGPAYRYGRGAGGARGYK